MIAVRTNNSPTVFRPTPCIQIVWWRRWRGRRWWFREIRFDLHVRWVRCRSRRVYETSYWKPILVTFSYCCYLRWRRSRNSRCCCCFLPFRCSHCCCLLKDTSTNKETVNFLHGARKCRYVVANDVKEFYAEKVCQPFDHRGIDCCLTGWFTSQAYKERWNVSGNKRI